MIRKYPKGDAELWCDEGGPVCMVIGGVMVMHRYEAAYGITHCQNSVQRLRREAKGHVLMAGLGIGEHCRMIQDLCASITIIEINQNVIDLVSQYVDHRQVKIIHDDFVRFIEETNQRYSIVWIDHDGATTPESRDEYRRRCQRVLFDDESKVLFWEPTEGNE